MSQIEQVAPSNGSIWGSGRLFDLLPEVYRVRDATHGQQLQALLGVIERELQDVEADIAGLYDNWFIETCREWVVPYLGDLLGVRGGGSPDDVAGSRRAFVANALRFRRGKGTVATLEQVARDLTGWPAYAVEYFLRLAATQNVNHLRRNDALVDLRDRNTLDLIDSAFDSTAHVADVRHIDVRRGRHNIPNVGVFLWRLQAYPVERGQPFRVGDGLYRFDPLGSDAPLFTRPQTEISITQIADEENVPAPLRPGALYFDLREHAEGASETAYYGPDRSLTVTKDDEVVPPSDIVCADLSSWGRPPAGKVAVDVARGRLSFPAGQDPGEVRVGFAYGFSADLGGGPYDRRGSVVVPGVGAWARTVSRVDPAADFTSLGTALAAWSDPTDGDKADGVITVMDGDTYTEELSAQPAAAALVIQAANGVRPVLRLRDAVGAVGEFVISGDGGTDGSLTIDGFLIEGGIRVEAESVGTLTLRHCSLVPGWSLDPVGRPHHPDRPSLVVVGENEGLQVVVDHSIIGPIRIPAESGGLTVRDGVVDSPGARRTPVLVSGSLASFPVISAQAPTVAISIGSEGPFVAELGSVPTTVADARDLLQAAVRKASGTAPFTDATVLSRNNRLLVIPGSSEPVVIEAHGSDQTAVELRLDRSSAREGEAMFSGRLSPFPSIMSAVPSVGVAMRAGPHHTIALASIPTSIAQARNQLEAAVRAAEPGPDFVDALVADTEDRLVVVPGSAAGSVSFSAVVSGGPSDDATTVVELGLQDRVPAIGGGEIGPGGDTSCAPATLERVTVFGRTSVRQLTLASNVIHTEPALVDRRQVGCTRFTFVPPGSRVPRRYHCQPGDDGDILPLFTSSTFVDPGYAQLAPACPEEISKGADDEGEMGAFNLLRQAARLESLRNGLDEYLPFGLEAGIFLVT